MKRIAIAVLVLLQFLAGEAYSADQPNVRAVFGSLPLSFEANAGQFDSQAKFVARAPGKRLFLVPEGMVLVLDQSPAAHAAQAVLRVEFLEAAPAAGFEGVDRLPGITNYFSAGLRITGVPSFARVRQLDVYPGIDVLYYDNQGRLEYDFIVAPGADPRRIRLRISGHDAARVAESGDLVLATSAGEVVMHAPMAYQERDGQRSAVPVRYLLRGNEARFELAAYDAARTLVIDPLLGYSTFLVGSSGETARAIAADASGNVYVTGSTGSTDFPLVGAFQTKKAGLGDAFVSKFNAAGSALIYSTYIGGKNGFTNGNGIAVDAAGNAYVTGITTSSAYPVTSGAYRTTMGSSTAGVLSKLSPQGNALVYSTYIPGGQGAAVALTPAGEAVVTGEADSTFTATPGAFQTTTNFGLDAYVLKLNAAGSGAVFSTFLGGSGNDSGKGVAIDAAGDVFVTGSTRSGNFPLASPLQSGLSGIQDAFVTKLNASGSALVYSTFLGGSLEDAGHGIALDVQGNAYIGGTTYSLDFPVQRAFQPAKAYTGVGHEGINQAFITKLDPSGQALIYSSYLGGQSCLRPGVSQCDPLGNEDSALAIAVDGAGIAYLAGQARSAVFPQVEQIQSLPNVYGQSIPFVAKVQDRASATRLYSVALGAKDFTVGDGAASGIAVDAAGNVFVAGYVVNEFPVTPGAFQYAAGDPSGAPNAVVFKLSPGQFPTSLSVSNPAPTSAQPITLTATVTGAVPDGQVTFYDNGVSLATALVTAGTAVHVVTFAAGVHELSAVYTGDNKVSRPLFLPVKQATSN